ncbi:MAG: oxidoreductase [Promethearchaeota archaeon]
MKKQKKWTANNIGDLSNKVFIVTGANSGLGLETARIICGKNASVVLACRNMEKAEKAKNTILKEFPNGKIEIIKLDLADLASIRQFVEEFKLKFNRLDGLINNAGIMIIPFQKTADGFEMQIGINYFGHFALTGLLLPTLLDTPNSRIVNVSSYAYRLGKIDFNNLNWEKGGYGKIRAYGRSKLAILLFTYELQRRLEAKNRSTIAVGCHPGWVATNLQKTFYLKLANLIMAQNIRKGVLPTLYATFSLDVRGGDFIGPHFLNWRGYPKKVKSNKRARDLETAKRLFEMSEKLTGVKYNI